MQNNYVSQAQLYKRIDRKKKKKIKLKLISKFQRVRLETKKSFVLAFLYTGHDNKLMHFMYLF